MRFRPLKKEDLRAATLLTQAIGWPQRLKDWQFMLHHGFGFVAEKDGRLASIAMGWIFGDIATIGMIVVDPPFQGQGIGRRITEAVLAELGDRTVILHATNEGAPLYTKLGFVDAGKIQQFHLERAASPASLAPNVAYKLHNKAAVREAAEEDFKSILEQNSAATHMDRATLLAAVMNDGYAAVIERDGIEGFGMMRDAGRGSVIGPVVARNPDDATLLIQHIMSLNLSPFTRIDVLENEYIMDWLKARGFVSVDVVRRMIRNPKQVSGSAWHAYALISQALA